MQNITRLFDFPYYQLAQYDLKECLVTKYEGQWVATSTKEYINKANAISRALLRLGVKPNDKIALISMTNRTEWNIMDIGILQLGAQNVPIYPTISQEDYAYVLNHSESKYCFVSCSEIYEKVKAVQDQVPSLKGVYSFDQLSTCKNWKELLELGADTANQNEVEQVKGCCEAKRSGHLDLYLGHYRKTQGGDVIAQQCGEQYPGKLQAVGH